MTEGPAVAGSAAKKAKEMILDDALRLHIPILFMLTCKTLNQSAAMLLNHRGRMDGLK